MIYNSKEKRTAEGAAYELISPPQGVSAILFPTRVFQHLVQSSFKSSQMMRLLPDLFFSSSNRNQHTLTDFLFLQPFSFISYLKVSEKQISRHAVAAGARVLLGELSPGEKASSVTCQHNPRSEPLICSHFHIRRENVLLCLTAVLARPCFH